MFTVKDKNGTTVISDDNRSVIDTFLKTSLEGNNDWTTEDITDGNNFNIVGGDGEVIYTVNGPAEKPAADADTVDLGGEGGSEA